MPISPSRLRGDIYRILDTILETGEPLEVERRGRILRIVPPERISKLDRLKKRVCISPPDHAGSPRNPTVFTPRPVFGRVATASSRNTTE